MMAPGSIKTAGERKDGHPIGVAICFELRHQPPKPFINQPHNGVIIQPHITARSSHPGTAGRTFVVRDRRKETVGVAALLLIFARHIAEQTHLGGRKVAESLV